MFKFVVVLAFAACALGAAVPEGMLPQADGRIVGGTTVSISSFPYQISLQRNGAHSCGGAIYNERTIVTAAHCVYGASASIMNIRAGSTSWNFGGVTAKVESIRIHPKYNPRTMTNDVAVLKLSSSLSYSSKVRNISLASATPTNGESAVCTGWGTLSSDGNSIPRELQMVNLNIVSQKTCSSNSFSYGTLIKAGMICANSPGKDACQGDSGGPLVSGGVLVGIVSFGIGCARPNYPGVYCNVADVNSWIVDNAF